MNEVNRLRMGAPTDQSDLNACLPQAGIFPYDVYYLICTGYFFLFPKYK